MSELDLEIFSSIPGYEGFYEISSYGKVISLARVCFDGKKKQTTRSRILSPISNGNGYMTVRLWKNGKQKIQYVHRLVLMAFNGIPKDGFEACHGDGNRKNNFLSNLRWGSKKENISDKFKHGTVLQGELASASKLTTDYVMAIRMNLSSRMEQRDIAQQFGVSQSAISDIATHKTWKHI